MSYHVEVYYLSPELGWKIVVVDTSGRVDKAFYALYDAELPVMRKRANRHIKSLRRPTVNKQSEQTERKIV